MDDNLQFITVTLTTSIKGNPNKPYSTHLYNAVEDTCSLPTLASFTRLMTDKSPETGRVERESTSEQDRLAEILCSMSNASPLSCRPLRRHQGKEKPGTVIYCRLHRALSPESVFRPARTSRPSDSGIPVSGTHLPRLVMRSKPSAST